MSAYHFVMPADGLNPRDVDEFFHPQADHLRRRGHSVSPIPDSSFREAARLRSIPPGSVVVYRGWMVRPEEYARFEASVRAAGACLLTDATAYALAHELPRWYDALTEYTPETVVVKEASQLGPTLDRLGWGAYFLKDFVKSLKVDGGSIVRSREDAERWLREMLYYRDELEGGICIRRVEAFVPESEIRLFVLNGAVYAPRALEVPEPAWAAAERIACPFFTVDVAQTTSRAWRIVELGDGQVSDLVGWTPEQFAQIWPDAN
jgi:ATP-grasp domain, R2K clade family 3